MKMLGIIASAIALTAATSAFASDYPVTVTDDRPTAVTFEEQPKNIVTLANYATDLAVALGITPIGLTTYEGDRPVYLGAAVDDAADLGDLTAPNLEKLADMDVDLTVGMLRYNAPFEEEISAVGKFIAFNTFSIADSDNAVMRTGEAFGYADETKALLADFDTMMADFKAHQPEQKTSYLFIWNYFDTFYAYYDNIMTAEMISMTGAENKIGRVENVESEEGAFLILDPEQLLKLDPDVLLIFTSNAGPIKHSPFYDRMSAVKNNRAYSVGYQYSQPAGPIARKMVMQEAAHLLFPDHYAKPDMPEGARATHIEFAK